MSHRRQKLAKQKQAREQEKFEQLLREAKVVFITDTLAPQEVDWWVKDIAVLSGQPVSLATHQGAYHVVTTGDFQAVRDAVLQLRPWHDWKYRETLRGMRVRGDRLHNNAAIEKMVTHVWKSVA